MPIKNITTHLYANAAYLFWAFIGIVTTLLLMEHSTSIAGFPHMDKAVHMALFFILTVIGYCAYAKHSIWLYTGLIAYGGITELLQATLTVTRYASIFDWLADMTGILLCALAIKKINSRTITKTPYVS